MHEHETVNWIMSSFFLLYMIFITSKSDRWLRFCSNIGKHSRTIKIKFDIKFIVAA